MKKKLYRSRDDILLAGVMGGLAEYFEHDSTLWRLGFIIFLIITGIMPGVLLYVVAWLIIPQKPTFEYADITYTAHDETKEDIGNA